MNAEASVQFDPFYYVLQYILSSVPHRDIVIILGDFNARVGSNFVSRSSVIGPQGLGECNEDRMRLLDLCVSNKLLITNTWFQHKPLHQATWYCNGDHSRPGHMMDSVIVNSRFHSSVLDTRSTYHVSDHEMVVTTMRFVIKAKCCQSWVLLCQTSDLPPNSQIVFSLTLAESLPCVCQSKSPELSCNDFKAAMNDAYKTLPELSKKQEGRLGGK